MCLIQNIVAKILVILLGGDIMFMVAIFVGLIVGRPEKWDIDKVPAHLRDFVLADLGLLGLDGYGNPLVEDEVVK